MSIALLLARLLLAGVFAVAGLAKLIDRAGSRQALIGFGLPARLATPGGILLPLVELVMAAALIPLASAWWGAVGVLALVLLFIVGIVFNLARGRTPDCHCFGQVYSTPIGWPTLSRNLLLAAVAGFVIGFGFNSPGMSATDWFVMLAVPWRIVLPGGILLVALLVGICWLLLHVLRQQGSLLLRIEAVEEQVAPPVGLSTGTPAPAFALAGLDGETITLDALRASGKPIFLLFSNPGCGPCNTLLPEVGRWQREYSEKVTVALISRGTMETNRSKASEHGIGQILVQEDREIASAYQAYGTPGAVLVHPDGSIGSAVAQGAEAIRSLVAQAVSLSAPSSLSLMAGSHGNTMPPASNGNGRVTSRPAALPVEEPAPVFNLPDLQGKLISLADFRGQKTLLLFWNQNAVDEIFAQKMTENQNSVFISRSPRQCVSRPLC